MRIPMIAGNWKMNTTIAGAIDLVKKMQPQLEAVPGVEKVLCPPFISLSPVENLIQNSSIKLGAQNVYFEPKGAYTGEISPLMLSGLCEYVIIGHSERRQYFHETGEMISKKVRAAIDSNLKPILCIGENLKEYEDGKTDEVITDQLAFSLVGISKAETLTIAYEPIWAIGTGKAATGSQAEQTIKLIRSSIARKYGSNIGESMRILYGGSVTAANIEEFVSQSDIDGALVGGASLKAQEFIDIVKITARVRNIV